MRSAQRRLGSRLRLWCLEIPRVNLIDIIEENLPRSDVAFIPWLHRFVYIHATLPVWCGRVLPMTTKCTLCRLLWQQRVLVSVALDVIVKFSDNGLVSLPLNGRFRR